MRKLLTIWLIPFLCLSLGNLQVIAREDQQCEGEITDSHPLTACGRRKTPGREQRGRIKRGRPLENLLESLKEKDPQRYESLVRIKELERRSRQLAWEYREATEGKEAIKDNLRGLLNELFDLRQEEQEIRARRLERRLKKLQENIIRRKENKETIINQRLKKMTGEVDHLQW